MILHFKQEADTASFSGFHSGAVENFTVFRYCAPSLGAGCPHFETMQWPNLRD